MRRFLAIIATALCIAASAPEADAAALCAAEPAAAAPRKKAPAKSKPKTKTKTRTKAKTKAKAAPRTSGDVRKEQRRTAGEIEKTQQQINTNTRETRRQLNRLASLDAEISRNEQSIASMKAEVDALERRVKSLSDSIDDMAARVGTMRGAYARSLRAMRSRRSRISPVAFVLGAGGLSEAWRRARYIRELSAAHAAKAKRLKAESEALEGRRAELAAVHEQQRAALGRMAVAQTTLRDKQHRADTLVASLKREGASLKRVLAEKRNQAAQLDRELDRIIAEEQRRAEEQRLAEERRKREEEARLRAEAEAKAKADTAKAEAAKNPGTAPAPAAPAVAEAAPAAKTQDKAPAKTPAPVYTNTAAEDRALSGSFTSNKGRLLFPVAGSYRIVSAFGRTDHPRIPGVQIQNSGIDIEAAGTEASARAVFDGTVTSVFRIDGYQNIVILRHGEYLTVYAGLDRIAVRKGDKVKAGRALGHIFSDPDDSGRSVLHFELRHEKQKLNPAEWVKP